MPATQRLMMLAGSLVTWTFPPLWRFALTLRRCSPCLTIQLDAGVDDGGWGTAAVFCGDVMPNLPTKPCALARCGKLTRPGERYCEAHKAEHRKRQDQQRGSSARRGYGSKWQKARDVHLKEHPLCVHCLAQGYVVAATVVDHIIPHKGDQKLFWSRSNWQSLCKTHHDQKTAKEDGGFGH